MRVNVYGADVLTFGLDLLPDTEAELTVLVLFALDGLYAQE